MDWKFSKTEVGHGTLNLLSSSLLENVPELPDTAEHSRTDLSRDLAALHEICVAHSDELRTLSNERGVMQVS